MLVEIERISKGVGESESNRRECELGRPRGSFYVLEESVHRVTVVNMTTSLMALDS